MTATVLVVAALYVLAEGSLFHLEVRGHALSVSLSDLALVVGLFLLPPHWLLVARLAPAVVLFVVRRTALVKAVFNLGLFTAEIGVAFTLLQVLAPDRGLGVGTWLATYLTVAVVDLLGGFAVVLAMRLLGSAVPRRDVVPMIGAVVVSGFLSTTLALMAIVVLDTSVAGLLLLAALAAVVAVAHHAYYRLLRRHQDLNRLFAFTQTVGAARDADGVIANLLDHARELLNAESAVLRLLPGLGGTATDSDPLLSEPHPRLIPRGSRDPLERQWLARNGLRDALLVPVRDETHVVAVLQVGNRLGAAGTFTRDDLKLLQTLVAHVEVLWHNGRLVDQLRHDATHDALTGLGNRTLFNDGLQALIDGGGHGATLLLDLDRFKEVNDALGHPVGDVLLEKVAARLLDHVPTGSQVARLGGDEFAVLLRGLTSPEEALATARAARAALTGAFEVTGTFLEVGVSVGVAMVPADGEDAATVLRRADLAMYEAKRTGAGVVRYSPVLDHRSTGLLELAGELRSAVEQDQIVMYFQPKESLRTGRIVGFEALARWMHPERGVVMPEVFVPLSEQTGLVGLLGEAAASQALEQCRTWLSRRPGVGVAVNLSPRRLLEPGLAASLDRLLAEHEVPAELLTLEITESTVMADPDAAVRAMHQLRDLGVRLSVDDFGTGYSSLNYLHRLPVQEVKIDKSFVLPMHRDVGATAIVRSIVELAHTLELTVVAEGVENEPTRQALVELGCDVGQGYGLAYPMPPEDVQDWLVRHDATRRDRRAGGRPRAV
ncbi:putative bifunctional diguanylate cyclase/phosphodiesterase [Quadrisphaera sp. GCM10027208]|uniref:putative bifunctional diguanylate cyclase/phosphodiesterase n=1 Tax=Quadrisphaera sp. GCM10027208 TaxID=3273423 RepID=UPI003606F2F7